MKRFALILSLWPTAGSASEELVNIYSPLLAQCYEKADGYEGRTQCIGTLSDACISGEDGGETTLGTSQCFYSEAEYWDVLLNREYRATREWARVMDTDVAEYFPEYANRAKTLLEAQRAWIAFRDAECADDYASMGSGSLRHIYGSSCFLQMTAERTIELRSKREMFE